MNEPIKIVPGKSDKELAEEFKLKIVEAYKPLLSVLDDLTQAGFQANIQCSLNAFGKMHISVLSIHKQF
jgi:hypothetical protein